MDIQLKKAIFPVAGMGTRFLPATKANPKEMLPIVDKPLIQYAVEEAISAGITELIFVTSSSKRAIEDHFDTHYELEAKLAEQGRYDLLETVRTILPSTVSCAYIRQPNAWGLGHAVLCAKNLIGQEPFAVLLADDLLVSNEPGGCLASMWRQYQRTEPKGGVIAVEQVPQSEVHQYGIIGFSSSDDSRIIQIVEKPPLEHAPSNWAVIGRYILTPHIFDLLEHTAMDARGEIQLTDALSACLRDEPIYAHRIDGVRFDCGSKFGYLQATLHHALSHPELKDRLPGYLRWLMESFDG